MATKREAKKDIRHLTEQVIIDAIEVAELLEKEADKKKVYKIISEVADTHNNLISRINNPDGKDNTKMVKAHFNAIFEDLLKTCNKAYEKLGKMVPKE